MSGTKRGGGRTEPTQDGCVHVTESCGCAVGKEARGEARSVTHPAERQRCNPVWLSLTR